MIIILILSIIIYIMVNLFKLVIIKFIDLNLLIIGLVIIILVMNNQ